VISYNSAFLDNINIFRIAWDDSHNGELTNLRKKSFFDTVGHEFFICLEKRYTI
jgi:hypothetical protein